MTYHVVDPISISDSVGAGGSVTAGEFANQDAPLETIVTSPNGGTIAISQGGVSAPTPAGYVFYGLQSDVTAPRRLPRVR